MEWTREKTLSLIHEYRKRRGLWDMTHDDYRKKEMKQKLLVEVSSSLGGGIPIVEIEKKFHTLRTQYHREINRMKRKEPYNSKWFGFKNLQFLSSPKACRSSKGRIKSEITEEGTVTTKFIVRDVVTQHETSPCSANSTTNHISEEFITIHRKPEITYQTIAGSSGGGTVATATSRSQEFEKLIEETTKDVEEDTEEAKPKIIKEINVPMEQHSYNTQLNSGDDVAGEMAASTEHDALQHETHQQQAMEEDEQQIETINIQGTEDEMAYQTSGPSGVGVPGGHTQTTSTTTIHHHALPARIIKIQRRDTYHDEDYYNDDNQQAPQHHIHTVPTNAPKRIYYESNGQQHTATLLTTPTTTAIPSQSNINATLINPPAKMHAQLQNRAQSQQQLSSPSSQTPTQQLRDDFSTYGEYVANEMRDITNREVLVALKHKINTALFEAHMAELQK